MIEPKREDLGRKVIYIKNNMEICQFEKGIITDYNDIYVHIKYDDDHSKSTSRKNLIWNNQDSISKSEKNLSRKRDLLNVIGIIRIAMLNDGYLEKNHYIEMVKLNYMTSKLFKIPEQLLNEINRVWKSSYQYLIQIHILIDFDYDNLYISNPMDGFPNNDNPLNMTIISMLRQNHLESHIISTINCKEEDIKTAKKYFKTYNIDSYNEWNNRTTLFNEKEHYDLSFNRKSNLEKLESKINMIFSKEVTICDENRDEIIDLIEEIKNGEK